MKILIPAYEPSNKFINLVDELKKSTTTEIIVINDGSGIEYEKIFSEIEKRNIKILKHAQNKGKGEAIKTGIKYSKEINEIEGCVLADCDGQHTVKDILKVMKKLKESNVDMVLGVRNFQAGKNQPKIPLRSKFGNQISKILFNAMTGLNITDTQTGLRAYSANIFDYLLSTNGSRYDYEFNILLNMKANEISFEQIEIQTIYENNNQSSHFNPIKDSILIYKPVLKFILSSFIAFLIDFSLLIIIEKITSNLLLSVVTSRIISSIINFICNKIYVFEIKDNEKLWQMIGKYYTLVVIIMISNYIMLHLLYEKIGLNIVISKIITETTLYILSFIVQRRIIFNKQNKSSKNT